MKTPKELSKIRKKAKAGGAAFELKVRKDLNEKGWIVDKFGNNVELWIETKRPEFKIEKKEYSTNIIITTFDTIKGKLIQAKNKWAGPNRPMMIGAGFPDFLCFKFYKGYNGIKTWEMMGVECKTNGILTKLEKEKCRWLLDNNIFSEILIASKTKVKNRVVIKYKDFEE